MTPNEIEELFQSSINPRDGEEEGSEDDEPILSNDEKISRIEKLQQVLATAQRLWASGSMELDLLAQKIGDGSRDGQSRGSDLEAKSVERADFFQSHGGYLLESRGY